MATTKAPRKKKEQIKRPDLKIGIKDFGPIAEGEIELKPLTVFIGPNNSGKSYVAMLIHSIFMLYNDVDIGLLLQIIEKNEDLEQSLFKLVSNISNMKLNDSTQVPTEIWKTIISDLINYLYQDKLGKEIENSFACKLIDLVKTEKDYFSLNIMRNSNSTQLGLQKGKIIIEDLPISDHNFNIKIRLFSEIIMGRLAGKSYFFESDIFNDSILHSYLKQDFNIDQAISFFIPPLKHILEIFLGSIISSYYIPATRSDKIKFYKQIVGETLKRATYFNIEEQQRILKLSGVDSDFISSIIKISPEEKGQYYQFAEELENELLKGSIVFESADANLLPEAKYRFQGVDIPLQRASSSVSEIAPLILYLKYIVEPGSVLIIEEPEAHLHPANIRILAKYLVRLVNKGVNVLITTHSEYLLEQLDNFVMLSNIDPEERVERYGYEKDDFLKHTDFAVYEFHYDKETGTSKIKKARLTKKDGVSQDEFVKVFEELYEETDKLRRDLSDE
jgi:predicted ATPase